ncbi:hypothetical protein C8Q77DRAFT_811072 [Trametes polyzona]|nr:hypothetical protein C8Q77DRAFT_811072 [Trametes polyzona]
MPAPMTIHHPYVEAYLRCAAASMHEAERRSHEVRSSSDCVNPSWHALAGHGRTTNWWRVEYGGVARPEAVANSLAAEYTSLALNAFEARRVYALAALAVYAFPTHPAHWAFWARNAKQRAAEVVHEIVCESSLWPSTKAG